MISGEWIRDRDQGTEIRGQRFTLVVVTLTALVSLTACAEAGTPQPSIRALISTPSPRAEGWDRGNAFLYGTPTPSRTPEATNTPGPSPTSTATPTPINGETLKGKLLFLSSRPLPANYAATWQDPNWKILSPDTLKLLQSSPAASAPVWQFDPERSTIAPCDPPRGTPTPRPTAPYGQPTSALLFGSLESATTNAAPGPCQGVYEAARTAQTFSADRRWEVYVGADAGGNGRPQIWVIDHQTNLKKMITRFGAGVSYDPVFAPDGYSIAFISQELGQDNLYVITRDATDLRRLTRIPGQEWNTTWEWIKRPTWSPDGTQVAFWSNKVSGTRQIWIVNIDGTNLHTISNDPRPAEDYDPVWVR